MLNPVVATSRLLQLWAKQATLTIYNVMFCFSGALRRLPSRTKVRWIWLAMQESFQNFLTCAFSGKRSPVSVFLQTAVIPTRYHTYVLFSMNDTEILRHTGWYCVALDFDRGTFLELWSSYVLKMAITGASSGFSLYLFSLKSAESLPGGFVVLHGCADASTLPKEVFEQLKGSFTISTESHSELFCFIQSTLSGEEALRAERS